VQHDVGIARVKLAVLRLCHGHHLELLDAPDLDARDPAHRFAKIGAGRCASLRLCFNHLDLRTHRLDVDDKGPTHGGKETLGLAAALLDFDLNHDGGSR
jgi:hypothetical protein